MMSNVDSELVPRVGELWTLAWDGKERGRVLIVEVESSFVTVFPVTDVEMGAVKPAFVLSPNRTGSSSMVVWSQLPTGIGSHLLSEHVKYAITGAHLELILSGDEQARTLAGVSFELPNEDDVVGNGTLHGIIRNYASLCHHQWPRSTYGEAVFDAKVFQRLNVKPMHLLWSRAASTHDEANALFGGKALPNELQTKWIADWLKMDTPSDLLRAEESLYSDKLMSPSYKPKVHQVMKSLNVDETRARSIWLRSALDLDISKPATEEFEFDRNLMTQFNRISSGEYVATVSGHLARSAFHEHRYHNSWT